MKRNDSATSNVCSAYILISWEYQTCSGHTARNTAASNPAPRPARVQPIEYTTATVATRRSTESSRAPASPSAANRQ